MKLCVGGGVKAVKEKKKKDTGRKKEQPLPRKELETGQGRMLPVEGRSVELCVGGGVQAVVTLRYIQTSAQINY